MASSIKQTINLAISRWSFALITFSQFVDRASERRLNIPFLILIRAERKGKGGKKMPPENARNADAQLELQGDF